MYQLDNLKKIPGLVHGFSDAKDGNMSFNWGGKESVIENRLRFLSRLGVNPDDCVMTGISHGTDIEIVGKELAGRGIKSPVTDAANADAMITTERGVFLMILTGDCLPVIVFDPVKGALALIHLSRINSPRDFVKSVIEKMKSEYGAKPEDMVAGIGPCIHKESYLFDAEEVRKRITDEKILEGFIFDAPGGKKAIDLVGYNIGQLVLAGVPGGNIEVSAIDTGADTGFFSHYRSRKAGETEGRMATIAGIVSA